MPVRRVPSLRYERTHWERGHIVAGIDEVGRGAWAGPLTLAAVVLPNDRRINKVRDSKQLSRAAREALYDRIVNWADAWAVGHASAQECDELGMSAAQKLAAQRAIDGLGVPVDHVLVDGPWDFVGSHRCTCLVKGDTISLSIAAASIIAKVTRDRIMCAEAEHFPAYGFESNVGYPAPGHVTALSGYGPSAVHRRSWVFMDSLPWTGVRRYERHDDAQPSLW